MIANFFTYRIGLLTIGLSLLLSSLILVSCSKDQLEIQNDFPFEVTIMPVPKDISKDQTVEIRITLKRSGHYKGTQYFMRYFQFDGQGTLRYYDDPPYVPNDLYSLSKDQFRLYYTSQSTVSQSFDIWISDNFGNETKLSYQFNNSD